MIKNIKTVLSIIPSFALAVYAVTHPIDPELLSHIQLWIVPAEKLAEQIEKRLEQEEDKK